MTKNDKKNPGLGTPAAEVGQSKCPTEAESLGHAQLVADEILIGRCRAGQVSAFGQLVERYQHRLYNAVFRIVGNTDDAQELTQDAFVRAYQGLRKFRSSSGFYTWLFRIGINLSINYRRRRQRVQLMPAEHLQGTQADGLISQRDDAASPVYQAEVREEHQRVLAAMEALEPSARAVVILRDIEGLDYAQIGKLLEIPVGTVKSRLCRARLQLRDKLLGTADDSGAPAT